MNRKILAMLLFMLLLLSVGCYRLEWNTGEQVQEPDAVQTADPGAEEPAEPTAEASAENQPVLIARFRAYESMGAEQTEAKMFVYDLDGDGTDEEIDVALDWDNNTTTVKAGSRSIVLDEGCMLACVYLADLDPASAYRNLIVCIDEASDDYITVALHPQGDALVRDNSVYGYASWDDDGRLLLDERTELFGTNFGTRAYFGDRLKPASEWLDCPVPDAKALQEERQELFENGTLLHLVRDLPCTVDGQPAVLSAGNCVLFVRFHESNRQAEICSEDGSVRATVSIDFRQDEDGYFIDGVTQEQYFDNLFFAD